MSNIIVLEMIVCYKQEKWGPHETNTTGWKASEGKDGRIGQ